MAFLIKAALLLFSLRLYWSLKRNSSHSMPSRLFYGWRGIVCVSSGGWNTNRHTGLLRFKVRAVQWKTFYGRWGTVQLDIKQTLEWSADRFHPQGRETQISLKEKKLIMSGLLWLMIKDNYIFIPFTKAKYVPSKCGNVTFNKPMWLMRRLISPFQMITNHCFPSLFTHKYTHAHKYPS